MREPDTKTVELLEWERILEALAVRAATPGGARAARQLPWLADREAVARSLAETAEAVTLEQENAVPDLGGAADLRGPCARLRSGSLLEDDELLDIARTLATAAGVHRSLRGRRRIAPLLAARAESIPDLEAIATRILDAYTPQGQLADDASPELHKVRREAAKIRSRILSLMESFQARFAEVLQDSFTTLRDDRFVLPVRADAHERFPGIVHGASGSGATLFVEPEPVVPLANDLRVVQAAMEREEARIRAGFTNTLHGRIDEVEAADEVLAGIDLKLAAATLARNLELHPPRLRDTPGARLVSARHPILMMTGREVVPGDIALETGRALLISGPNSGGKTVALKTAGLCGLMLRAGLPLPAAAESEAGLFGNVLADIGDNQSLDLSLSTFSARMVALARILDDARAGDLVALDEICAGTDPEEGAALAASVIETLVDREVAVIGTTHFPALKELAIDDPRMDNASVGYDPDTLAPTFRLIAGTPGPSAALHVAERCGVPKAVVNHARSRVPEVRQALSGAALRIHTEERRAETARREAEQKLREARAAHDQAQQALEESRQAGRRKAEREARELMEAVKRARRQVADAEARVGRRRLRPKDVRKARKVLDRTVKTVAPAGPVDEILKPAAPAGRPAAAADLEVGARVWITAMHHEGTIVRAPDKGRVRVAAGSLQLNVSVSDLRLLVPTAGGPTTGRAAARNATRPRSDLAPELEEAPVQTPENSLDLRGLYADEAIDKIEPFLDSLMQRGRTAGFLIHGHGTGALKKAVRGHLAGSRYVVRHRPGGPGEGGDGVTVVWIR